MTCTKRVVRLTQLSGKSILYAELALRIWIGGTGRGVAFSGKIYHLRQGVLTDVEVFAFPAAVYWKRFTLVNNLRRSVIGDGH